MEVSPLTKTVDARVHAAFEHLKRGGRFDEAEAQQLTSYPLVDALRDLVEESDVEALMRQAEKEVGPNRRLLLNLLQRFDQGQHVKAFLRAEWARSPAFEHRMPLVWRLLDDHDLGPDLRGEISSFVFAHLEAFSLDCATWFGGAEAVLPAIESRLRDQRFPRAKDWAYLCAAIGAADRRGLSSLLERYTSSQDESTAKVASRLSSLVGDREEGGVQ